jgi:hypothetical protein
MRIVAWRIQEGWRGGVIETEDIQPLSKLLKEAEKRT